uniref:NADH-ubiquinone oxidoreductase chain 2 n=1 Tax=Oxycarenus lugubris TaxID=2813423 RepID=A0A8T9ZZJ9_9HEMI|nr:NADH dehydrogenase subunit 2 [Oxycarenus lugubris]
MNYTKLLFLMILFMSALITMSSESWIGMWMGMEINLMVFIPLISKSKNKNASQGTMIYFLTQSIGSVIFLFSVLMNPLIIMTPYISTYMNCILMISLMIKLGVAPFHSWLPEIMCNLKWYECFLLMTWQKIPPMVIMMNLNFNKIIYSFILLSAAIGAIGGINNTSLRKIMAYSSINHMSWMMILMIMKSQWYMYLIIYSILIGMQCYMFNNYNAYFLNQLSSSMSSMTEKLSLIILMMSVGGLPPLLGFLPKWMVIYSFVDTGSYFMMTWMIMFSLLTLFYYLQLITPMMLNYSCMNKYSTKMFNNKLSNFIIIINFMLPYFSILNLF